MACQCPPVWGAIIPPPCDDHNPPGPRSLRERLEARIKQDAHILRRLAE